MKATLYTTYGTCLICQRIKKVRLTTPTLVKGRREGVCQDCARNPPKKSLGVKFKETKG